MDFRRELSSRDGHNAGFVTACFAEPSITLLITAVVPKLLVIKGML